MIKVSFLMSPHSFRLKDNKNNKMVEKATILN